MLRFITVYTEWAARKLPVSLFIFRRPQQFQMPLILPHYPHPLAAEELDEPSLARNSALLRERRAEGAFVEPMVQSVVGVMCQPADGHGGEEVGNVVPLVLKYEAEGFGIDIRWYVRL